MQRAYGFAFLPPRVSHRLWISIAYFRILPLRIAPKVLLPGRGVKVDENDTARDDPRRARELRSAQSSDGRLAMIAQQFLGLVQQLAFVLGPGVLVTSSQLR